MWCHDGTIPVMDVNVKGLEPEVVSRLAAQAESEGMSAQEWMRQALRRTAALLTPAELQSKVAERTPIPADRYAEVMNIVAARRAAGVGGLASPRPRRPR